MKRKLTDEERKAAIKYWQYRKAKARKQIAGSVGAFIPMFMTCDPLMNKGIQEKAKEKIKWARAEIKFAEQNIKKLKKVI